MNTTPVLNAEKLRAVTHDKQKSAIISANDY